MKKKNQQLLALVLFAVGGYLIYKKLYQKKDNGVSDVTIGGVSNSDTKNYVTTASSLNVRSQPNATSAIVTKLPKGEYFVGSPSKESTNWIAVWKKVGKASNIIGYVIATYVKEA